MQGSEISSEVVKHSLWYNGLLKWKLWKQQESIYEEIRGLPRATQTVVMLCARQFGKSYLGTLLGTEDCLRNPGVSVLVVGPTIKQTTDIVNQSLRNLSTDCPAGLIRRSKSESRWYVGESELLVGGFDIKNATRQRGKTLYRIYIEELVDSDPDRYHESLRSDLGPALTHSIDGKMIYLTTLPKVPDHPFILDTIPEAQLKGAFYSFTIEDNHQLTPEQKQACADRCGGTSSIEYRREYMNEMVRDQSLMVVPHYDETRHVVDFTSPHQYWDHITIDWGGVKDMTCALHHTYDFSNNRDLILGEKVFSANTSTKEIVESIREWVKHEPDHPFYPVITCDAPGQVLVDLAVEYGLIVRPPPKEDWLSAVNQMSTRFSEDRIHIRPELSFLRQSLRSGTFNKNRTDFERSIALGHCDGLAALMYGLRVQNRTSPHNLHQIPGGVILETVQPLMQVQKPTTYQANVRKFGRFK